MSSPVSSRTFLKKAVRSAAPDSLEGIVARHLLACVERFEEGAFGDAVGIADTLHESYLRAQSIVRLNDAFRCNLDPMANGQLVITSGVEALGRESVDAALAALRDFDDFTDNNDPYHEHDFGSFVASGQKFFWKIDYYDLELKMHSPDPGNPKVTRRVLTLMLPEEY